MDAVGTHGEIFFSAELTDAVLSFLNADSAAGSRAGIHRQTELSGNLIGTKSVDSIIKPKQEILSC
jgi:hypothetical protein